MHTNNNLRAQLRNLLLPHVEEVVVILAALLLLAGATLYSAARVGGLGAESTDILRYGGQAIGLAIDTLSSGDAWARLLLFGFWFIVGAVVYFIVWFFINIAIDLYNDIVISSAFVHPKSFHQSDFWLSIVGRAAVRTTAAIALGFYSIFWAWVYAPIAMQSAKNIFASDSLEKSLYNLLFYVLATSLSVHIGMILVRLTFFKLRILES